MYSELLYNSSSNNLIHNNNKANINNLGWCNINQVHNNNQEIGVVIHLGEIKEAKVKIMWIITELEKYNVQLIGAQVDAIDKAEDRERFKEAMDDIGIETAQGGFVHSWQEAESQLQDLQLPIIIRPSFTMGGTGGSIAYNFDEFQEFWWSSRRLSRPPGAR